MATQPYTLANGSTADGGQTNANFVEIYSNITNDNISASAAIALTKLASDASTSYVPVITASGTAFSIGNGTIIGRYIKVGRSVTVYGYFSFGSTTSYGTGTYDISIPVAAGTTATAYTGYGIFTDASTSIRYLIGFTIASGASVATFFRDLDTAAFGPAGVALQTSDTMQFTIHYESAS